MITHFRQFCELTFVMLRQMEILRVLLSMDEISIQEFERKTLVLQDLMVAVTIGLIA